MSMVTILSDMGSHFLGYRILDRILVEAIVLTGHSTLFFTTVDSQ